ncbi:MAG: MFS transporter [Anaerolineaceae bacterium]|nr:MFS transporter [Anaerolineaceae bacterium]
MPNSPRTSTIVTLGLGLFAAQFAWVIYNTYVPIFLQAGSLHFSAGGTLHGFGLSATQTGFIMTFDNIAALFLEPFTGAFSDRARSRFGRRLPFLMIGIPIAALGMALIPLALSSPLPVFIACLLLMVIAMACWRAPLFALMADLTPSAGSLLYAIYRPFPFWAAVMIFIFACGVILWRVQEPGMPAEGQSGRNPGFIQHLHGWFSTLSPARRKSMFFLTIAVFCYMMGFHPIEAFFSSYGVAVLKLSVANSGLVLSAAYITFILFAVPAGLLASKIGRKRTVFIGLFLFGLALLAAFFMPITPILVGLMALGGIGWAMIDINAFTMVLDAAPGADGAATGVYFIATGLAATAGPILNGWLIDLSGRNYSMIFLIGPAFFLLSFIFMLGVKHGEAQRAPGTASNHRTSALIPDSISAED